MLLSVALATVIAAVVASLAVALSSVASLSVASSSVAGSTITGSTVANGAVAGSSVSLLATVNLSATVGGVLTTVAVGLAAITGRLTAISVALTAISVTLTAISTSRGSTFSVGERSALVFGARAVALLLLGLGKSLLVGETGANSLLLGGLVGSTGKLATLSDGSAAHNGLVLVRLDLGHLVTRLPLTVSKVAFATLATVDSELAESAIVVLAVVVGALANAVAVTVVAVGRAMGVDSSTGILLGIPVAVAIVVGVAARPLVDTIGRRAAVFLRIPVGLLLVLAVEGDSGGLRHLSALGVILDDLPVLLDGDINVAELDLTLLALLDLRQLLPLEGKDEAVAASGVDVGHNPDVLDISGDDLFERLQSELLLVSPLAGRLIS
jgi:hypothetical protein